MMVGRSAKSGEEVLHAVVRDEPSMVEGDCGKFTSDLYTPWVTISYVCMVV